MLPLVPFWLIILLTIANEKKWSLAQNKQNGSKTTQCFCFVYSLPRPLFIYLGVAEWVPASAGFFHQRPEGEVSRLRPIASYVQGVTSCWGKPRNKIGVRHSLGAGRQSSDAKIFFVGEYERMRASTKKNWITTRYIYIHPLEYEHNYARSDS